MFKGQWQYKQGRKTPEEYRQILEETVYPKFAEIKAKAIRDKLLEAKLVYGYFPCQSDGNDLVIYQDDLSSERLRFTFPRQPLEQAGEVGWIDELFVRSDYRKKGLAQRMLSMALGWAEARGLRSIDLEVGEKHEPEPATRLYQQQGFQRINRARLTLRLARPTKSA